MRRPTSSSPGPNTTEIINILGNFFFPQSPSERNKFEGDFESKFLPNEDNLSLPHASPAKLFSVLEGDRISVLPKEDVPSSKHNPQVILEGNRMPSLFAPELMPYLFAPELGDHENISTSFSLHSSLYQAQIPSNSMASPAISLERMSPNSLASQSSLYQTQTSSRSSSSMASPPISPERDPSSIAMNGTLSAPPYNLAEREIPSVSSSGSSRNVFQYITKDHFASSLPLHSDLMEQMQSNAITPSTPHFSSLQNSGDGAPSAPDFSLLQSSRGGAPSAPTLQEQPSYAGSPRRVSNDFTPPAQHFSLLQRSGDGTPSAPPIELIEQQSYAGSPRRVSNDFAPSAPPLFLLHREQYSSEGGGVASAPLVDNSKNLNNKSCFGNFYQTLANIATRFSFLITGCLPIRRSNSPTPTPELLSNKALSLPRVGKSENHLQQQTSGRN